MDQPKFNKSFEALYAIAMKMADECIVNKTMKERFAKLTEEYKEVLEAFETHDKLMCRETMDMLMDELGDLLFVLLHIAALAGHQSAKSLLHKAMTKMLYRMNDPNYVAKN